MLRDAAAKSKEGKLVQAGLFVTDEALLVYDGPKDPEALWKKGKNLDRSSCKVGQQRVIRSRPIFHDWELTFVVNVDPSILEPSRVTDFVHLAGRVCGLGDWRPRHGRFIVTDAQEGTDEA